MTADQDSSPGKAWIIPMRGDIEPSMTAFVRRETRKALDNKAGFIIFEIDTFGGRVDSALQITSFIMSIKNARTVAWIHNSEQSMGVSWSAGAIIAFSCVDIYMANGTSMGAAAPITISPDGLIKATGEKTVAAVRSQMAALAERNGHPVGIALAMVDFDVELWEASVEGVTKTMTREELEFIEKSEAKTSSPRVERVREISPKGKLLSLTAGEAYRYGLAKGLADERGVLLLALGVDEGFTESNPSMADDVIFFLTSAPVQAILIILGLVMIFLEINTPGFGIPGTLAILCFLTVFGSSALLGLVESWDILMLMLGIGLLAVEIFLLPGFGITGISSIILIGLSLVLSMQDFVLPRFDWEWSILGRNVVVVSIGIITAILGIAIIALSGPKIKLFDAFTLKTQITGTAGGPDASVSAIRTIESRNSPEEEGDYKNLFGKAGIAVSTLRPSGKAEIEGQIYSVETEGAFIDLGKELKVIHIRGNRIIVRHGNQFCEKKET